MNWKNQKPREARLAENPETQAHEMARELEENYHTKMKNMRRNEQWLRNW